MECEQLALVEGFKAKVSLKKSENVLKEILEELMEERNVTLADIHRKTGIAWSTLQDMKNGKNRYQKLNKNILELAKFFNVSIHYLCFGVGSDEPVFEIEIEEEG